MDLTALQALEISEIEQKRNARRVRRASYIDHLSIEGLQADRSRSLTNLPASGPVNRTNEEEEDNGNYNAAIERMMRKHAGRQSSTSLPSTTSVRQLDNSLSSSSMVPPAASLSRSQPSFLMNHSASSRLAVDVSQAAAAAASPFNKLLRPEVDNQASPAPSTSGQSSLLSSGRLEGKPQANSGRYSGASQPSATAELSSPGSQGPRAARLDVHSSCTQRDAGSAQATGQLAGHNRAQGQGAGQRAAPTALYEGSGDLAMPTGPRRPGGGGGGRRASVSMDFVVAAAAEAMGMICMGVEGGVEQGPGRQPGSSTSGAGVAMPSDLQPTDAGMSKGSNAGWGFKTQVAGSQAGAGEAARPARGPVAGRRAVAHLVH